MFTFSEWEGQNHTLDKHGEIEINTEYVTRRKSAWWVLLKVAGLTLMIAAGYGIALPTLIQYLPLWKAIVVIAGVMLIYLGLAFFIRPEANTDNLGWCGGLANDPFQYSDDINRALWQASCLLGPGRFAATTLLDLCVLSGIAGGEEVIPTEEMNFAPPESSESQTPY